MLARVPLVSVITITRDNRDGLSRSLLSTRSQTFPDYEQIVIDGASTDGTAELLASPAASHARVVSEPDNGIADAFNKGVANARGTWLCFLNAGDTWSDPTAIERAARHFGEAAIVTGHSITQGHISPPFPITSREPFPRRAWLSHQASFFHRGVFETCGPFDTRFRICMDYEMWLRVLPRFEHTFIPEVFVDFEGGGVSSQQPERWRAELFEANRMHLRHAALHNLRIAVRMRLHDLLRRRGWLASYTKLRHAML